MTSIIAYFDRLLAFITQFTRYRNNASGTEGSLPVKANDTTPLSSVNLFLINPDGTVVENSGDLNAMKSVFETHSGNRTIYDISTQIIHRYTGGAWIEYSRVYLAEYLPGGVFYYNNLTRRLYWAEPNAEVVYVGGGNPI